MIASNSEPRYLSLAIVGSDKAEADSTYRLIRNGFTPVFVYFISNAEEAKNFRQPDVVVVHNRSARDRKLALKLRQQWSDEVALDCDGNLIERGTRYLITGEELNFKGAMNLRARKFEFEIFSGLARLARDRDCRIAA